MIEQNSKNKTIAQSKSTKPTGQIKPTGSVKPASPFKTTSQVKPTGTGAKSSQASTVRPMHTNAATKTSNLARPSSSATSTATRQASQINTKSSTSVKPTVATKSSSSATRPSVAVKTKPANSISKPNKPSSGNKKGAGKKPTDKKKKNILIAAVAMLLVAVMVIGIVLGIRPKDGLSTEPPAVLPNNKVIDDNPTKNNSNPTILPAEPTQEETYEKEYTSTTAVGFSSEVTGTVERVKPVAEIKDGGLPSGYPKYGYTLKEVIGSAPEKVAARNALINESSYLTATGTSNAGGGGYTWMDKDGFLYKGTTASPEPALDANNQHRQLYKHTASVGLYLGDVSDDEPGVVKNVTIRPRGYNSYSVTGLYAPAGEVIKIEISQADMEATGGITIHIGQALYNGQANNIWAEKGQMQRIPHLLNTMTVNKNTATLENGVYTAYVGSFIGGPLYIRNTRTTFSATISGGVTYSHFILGYTTKEEFEENNKSSVPFFDLEVWNYGVLHSGPKRYAQNLSYDDIYKAAILWEKVSSVTTTGSSQGIVFLYDPFVAAGAAVAFPGRSSVNCPMGWMSSSLNYNSIVSSGAWGNFHEYHHNFQNYGVGNGGEVTNNGMTLVSYALFTKISSRRGISANGGAGLGGWNSYTSATWALSEVLKIPDGGSPSNGKQGLSLYATLLHNFGANSYIQAKFQQQSKHYGQTYQGYLRAWQDITHNDMTYFFKDILKGIDGTVANKWRNPDYPTFVPVSSVYQTGRSYMYDGEKRYFKTMQPYIIPYGADFNIDLSKYNAPNGQYASGSIVIPNGFSYRIKSVTQPENGKIEVVDNYNLKFKPGADLKSGEIIVTLEIKKNDNAFKVEDVDLILEFEQSHETNKTTLTRTTYTFSEDNMYSDAQSAYENNFAGYDNITTADHSNPTQNCNTDIWLYADTPENRKKFPNSPDSHFTSENTILQISGKLYFNEAGKYRIYIRGRMNCAFYYSLDGGQTYNLGGTIKDTTLPSGSHLFRPGNENSYVDLELKEGTWVYIKEILIVQTSPTVSYLGLGYSKWTDPMFTVVNKYYDAEGNETTEENAIRTETHYYDYQGNEVTEEEANNAAQIPPSSTAQPNYINAYRENYEFPSNAGFETDYFYTREYTYSYSDSRSMTASQTCIQSNYQPWDNSSLYSINNLFDDDDNTFIHSNKTSISDSNPFAVTVRLSKEVTANRLIFHGSAVKSGYATFLPKTFKIWVSENGTDWTLVSDVATSRFANLQVVADFDDYHTFSYYKTEITDTHSTGYNKYICLNKIELVWNFSIPNGKLFTPDNDAFTYSENWRKVQAYSTFGQVYLGQANSTMTFKFNGTRLALISSFAYDNNYEVYIDGVKVESIDLKEQTTSNVVTYISNALENKTHSVTVKCLGETSIDSIVVYQ